MLIDVCLKSTASYTYSSIMPSRASWLKTISGLPNAVSGTTTTRLRFIFVIKALRRKALSSAAVHLQFIASFGAVLFVCISI